MKIVFMGNPDFAVPSLNALAESAHTVVGVVSNPERPMGRGRKLTLTDVGQRAKELGLPFFPVDDLKSSKTHTLLSGLQPDLFAVVAYRILPKSLLEIPTYGAVNLHASLLPRYRGAAPIQWALINGDKETGVTTFQIQPKVDTGGILMQKSVPIRDEDNAGSLFDRLSVLGADIFLKTIDGLAANSLTPQKQDDSLATPAPKIKPEMQLIQWAKPASEINGWIRGLSPAPRAYTTINGKRLYILKAEVVEGSGSETPGTLVEVTNKTCFIRTGDGLLRPIMVLPEGRKTMNFAAYQAGARLQTGERFGT